MADHKRKHTMNTAIALFAENGFDKTSTQLIAKKAGIGTGTLFGLFSSKEELVRQCYLYTKKEMISVTKSGVLAQDRFDQILYKMWKNLLNWCLKNPAKHSFTLQIASSRLKDPEIDALVEKELLFFHLAVHSAQESGKLAPLNMELINSVIWSFLNLAIHFAKTPEIAKEDDIFQMMLHSLKVERSHQA